MAIDEVEILGGNIPAAQWRLVKRWGQLHRRELRADLRITFDDGLSREIDFWPALAGELFLPLRDLEFFNSVRLDPEVGNLVWPNGADFDPSELHDWPEVEEAWAEWARRWWADRATEAD